MDYPKKADIPWEGEYAYGKMWYHEDGFICCKIKHILEAEGMQIAPLEVAKYFGHEHPVPEVADVEKTFVFHKWWGRNEQYPRFENPWTKRWKAFKDVVRPLLFWRRIRR